MASEAQIRANSENAKRASGPRDTSKTRFNATKHALTSQVMTSEADAEKFRRYIEDFTAEMGPRTAHGRRQIERMARASIIMDRAARHESAAVEHNVRHAIERFDQERIDGTARLFEDLGEDPRHNLRKLRMSPEGVDRLMDAWRDLKADLTADPKPIWSAEHMEQAAHMTGYRSRHARGSRVGALSRGFWGDFDGLAESDGGHLPEPGRQKWAKIALIGLIDAEIAELEAHRQTLDFETIELDRAEAPARALFDASREASLARRYEKDAERIYFKALKEFRQVEAEFQAPPTPTPAPPPPRPPAPSPAPKLGSFREEDCEPLTDEERAEFEGLMARYGIDLGPPRGVSTAGQPPNPIA